MYSVFVFPGQGSQSVGMLAEMAAAHPEVEAAFSEVSDELGYDLWERVQNGPREALDATECTQPAMLAAGVATWRVWGAAGGGKPDVLAGHSLGEYSALVAAEALSLPAAARVVSERARLMQAAVPSGQGAMAAVLGLEDDQIKALCAAQDGIVEAVNFNAPGQVVIAGTRAAVAAAGEACRAAGARKVLSLPVSVPAHSSLMKGAAEHFAETLAATEFAVPAIRIVHNAGEPADASADALRQVLHRQLFSPVPWRQTVETLLENDGVIFTECGPGKVLAGLIKRCARRASVRTLVTPEDIRNAVGEGAE